MKHEDAVLAKHPDAREFRPVKRLLKLVGWTFEASREGKEHLDTKTYGWVTADGEEVSSDLLAFRDTAERNLRTYVSSKTESIFPFLRDV